MLPGPLHRVTPLRDDPIAGWLTDTGRLGTHLKWGLVWLGYMVVVRAAFFTAAFIMETTTLSHFNVVVFGFSFQRFAAMGVSALLLLPTRHLANVVRAGAIAKASKEDASDEARALDDLAAFPEQPDGSVLSLVGWVRGHGYLSHSVGGHKAVGVALPCRGLHLVEALHNFDLVDESGAVTLVVSTGARLLGKATVPVSRMDAEDRAFLNALDLPPGIVPTYWTALVVRDGDPVMVVGTKTTFHDMTELQRGRPTARMALASQPKQPLLVIPLDAERRDV